MTEPQPITRPRSLAELTEADRALALERFHLLRPHLQEGVPLAQIARTCGMELRTAQRWVERYREAGLVGLARRGRADRSKRHLSLDLQQLIEGLALRKPPANRRFRASSG